MVEARLDMDHPTVTRTLTSEDQEALIRCLTAASADMRALGADKSFRYHSLTASVARLVDDWCQIVAPEVSKSQKYAANDSKQ